MSPLAEQLIVRSGVIGTAPKEALPSVAEIQRTVATFYAIDPASMKSQSHVFREAHPRQMAMYLAKKMTANTLPAIGRHFGNRHHTTVLHGIRQVEQRFRDPNDTANADVRAICEALAHAVEARQ